MISDNRRMSVDGKPSCAPRWLFCLSYQRLQLIEDLEDRMDLDAARAALKEKAPRVAWNRLKGELGPSQR